MAFGEFGDAVQWSQPARPAQGGAPPGPTVEQLVSGWIQNNQAAIGDITEVLLAYTHPNLRAQRQRLINFVNQTLLGLTTAGSRSRRDLLKAVTRFKSRAQEATTPRNLPVHGGISYSLVVN